MANGGSSRRDVSGVIRFVAFPEFGLTFLSFLVLSTSASIYIVTCIQTFLIF
jgi:hypothetical protein